MYNVELRTISPMGNGRTEPYSYETTSETLMSEMTLETALQAANVMGNNVKSATSSYGFVVVVDSQTK